MKAYRNCQPVTTVLAKVSLYLQSEELIVWGLLVCLHVCSSVIVFCFAFVIGDVTTLLHAIYFLNV